jgi:hypothetical protein
VWCRRCRGGELKPDVLVIEAFQSLVRGGEPRQVAAEPPEAVTVASANRYVGVEVEAAGTRAARA